MGGAVALLAAGGAPAAEAEEVCVVRAAGVAGVPAGAETVAGLEVLEAEEGVKPSRTLCSCREAMSSDQRISRVW